MSFVPIIKTVNLSETDNAVLDGIESNTNSGSVVGGGTEADALRVTIANNSTGVLSVDDGGGALTVDGTVAVTHDALTELGNAIDTEVQVDIVGALPAGTNNIGDVDVLTLPSLPAGTNAIGKLAANSGVDIGDVDILSIAAGDNNIGNVDVVTLPSLPAGTNAIGKLAANSGVDIGDVDVTSIAAGENYLGEVGMPDTVITITCTLNTSAYASGDTLFDTQEIAGAVRVNGDSCILQSVHVIDIDDQGVEMDLIFFNANTSLGTENSAPDINDTEVLTTLGKVNIAAGDYIDLGANRIATVDGLGLVLKAGAATTSLYVAGITRGTPTHTATGLTIMFGFLRN